MSSWGINPESLIQGENTKDQTRKNFPFKNNPPNNDIRNWIHSKRRLTLVFHGTSKGNPSLVGFGGVTYTPEEETLVRYVWTIGQATNKIT